ncbi:LysR family transcriptional regulator [Teichococcus vastitatis]|uniref:LysR family transcriptional regulator n=1 Tax=Teichococcus vastitatis TaxID=2307076 RepID=UPI00192E6BE9|nr:LysR family transcriptional regulator [Pseudoroseomonas vastitatis]
MTLRQLEILRAVIRGQTTLAAAKLLAMSQPAVSNAIRQMELQLGFPLFERINNRLYPTDAARIIHEESEPLFAMHAALRERVQDLRESKVSRLRILSTPPLGHGVLPQVLAGFSRRHPQLRTFFDVRDLDEVTRGVESGQADLGFGLNLGAQPALEVEELQQSRMVCVFRSDHPLARREVVTPADLPARGFIALDAGTRMGAAVRGAFQAARQPFHFSVEVRYCNTACVLVEAGMGASVVDPYSAAFAGRPHLMVRPFEPAIPCTAWAFWSARRPLAEIGRRLVREVQLALARR